MFKDHNAFFRDFGILMVGSTVFTWIFSFIVDRFKENLLFKLNFDSSLFSFITNFYFIGFLFIGIFFLFGLVYSLWFVQEDLFNPKENKKTTKEKNNGFKDFLFASFFLIFIPTFLGFIALSRDLNFSTNNDFYLETNGMGVFSIYKVIKTYPNNSIGNLKTIPISIEKTFLAEISCKENGFNNMNSCKNGLVKNLQQNDSAFLNSLKKDKDVAIK